MICPVCGSWQTKVEETRNNKDGRKIKRRRKCMTCSSTFNTWEAVDYSHVRPADPYKARSKEWE